MTICFLGRYDNKYSRNRVLIHGFKKHGVEIIECRTELKGIKKYFDLIKKHKKIKNDYDILFIAWPGWHSAILFKFITKKPIIFDAFVSIYDSTVLDRKNTKKYSLNAMYFWFTDWLACKFADKILLDTNEHIKYFVEEFGLKKGKFIGVLVGSDTEVFYPREKKKANDKFMVFHYGSLIPLQGIKYILESARLLEGHKDIQFNILGSGLRKVYEKKDFSNVKFIDNVSYEKLPEYISQSDICLGIFGDTNKTQRVIPNKVYEYSALKMSVITADTPAIRELFDDNDLLLIPTANSQEIANAILKLKDNEEAREKLAQNAYNKFIKNCTPEIITKKLLDEIKI